MKKALLKDSIKEIKNTYKRFLSILLMAFLGVGFFAGIRASSPDMVDTINYYYNEHQVYDIQILSTLGLTNEDIEEISKIDNIEQVDGTYEVDGAIEIDSKEVIAKVMCLSDFNKPNLIEGNLPQSKNECVVEESFLKANNKEIGDTIEIDTENSKNDEGEEIPYLYEKELKIVGTVQSPIYISRDRGTSKLGAGKINYYLYILKDNVQAEDVYTNIFIKVKDSEKYKTSSKKYEDYIEEVKQNIEEIKEERENARHEALVNSATKKVEEAENELNTEKQNAQSQIDEAEKKIADGKIEIQEAENEVNTNEQKANSEFASAYNQIKLAKTQIVDSEKEITAKEQEANTEFAELETQKQQLQENLNQTNQGITQVENQYNQIAQQLNNPQLPEEQKNSLEQTKQLLETQLETLKQAKQQLEDGIASIDNGIASGKQELENAKKQLETAKKQLNKKENEYYAKRQTVYAQIENAKNELENAKQELDLGEKELEKNKKEFEEKIAEAEGKLIDAKQKITEIENPKWYILDRYGNSGYNSFIQDTESIENIGKVFPIVFFVVATLISLTSMTRMVEEQRTQIGTLKALGYNKIQIASKYIIYASLACIIGGILGMCVGFILLPKIIWKMYEMMYQMTDIKLSFNWEIGGAGLILISLCIIGATIYTVLKELMHTPATLMRPKAPKMGKRVILEKIPIIWKHLSFSKKVTVRNIFRYKKRFLMTIIGIFGCTSLILTGFGLRDSIRNIMPSQFEKIFNYDMQINLKSGLEEEQKQEYITKLQEKDEIEKTVETYMTSSTLVNGENEEDVQIIVPEDEMALSGTMNIVDLKTKQSVQLSDNEICLTDKVAQLLGVKEGDTIILKDSDENEKEVKISNIVENYIYHYVYMSKVMYEKLYDEPYSTNVILTKNKELTDEQEDRFAKEIMEQNEVASLTRTSSAMNMLDDTMKSLNYVVVILIVSAGLLAFVVLYNLSNVNISERIRELATIKVLGFYDKEVYSYVTRETIILTIIGIVLGMFGGYFLNYFIMGTCEINMLRFSKIIEPMSYVYSVLITVVFTLIVNFVTYFALKKIDMIESLKSIE